MTTSVKLADYQRKVNERLKATTRPVCHAQGAGRAAGFSGVACHPCPRRRFGWGVDAARSNNVLQTRSALCRLVQAGRLDRAGLGTTGLAQAARACSQKEPPLPGVFPQTRLQARLQS